MKNILIIDKSNNDIFEDFFEETQMKDILHLSAKSTSRNFILSLLNMSDTKKCVYLFDTTQKKLGSLKKFAKENLNKNSSGLLISWKKEDGKMKEKTKKKVKNDKLIVVVIKNGFVELVLNATKGFEVSGATILEGKGVGKKQTAFMGMALESQREIVLIATTSALEKQIVNTLKEELKTNENANGIIFTLPIESFIKFDKTK